MANYACIKKQFKITILLYKLNLIIYTVYITEEYVMKDPISIKRLFKI